MSADLIDPVRVHPRSSAAKFSNPDLNTSLHFIILPVSRHFADKNDLCFPLKFAEIVKGFIIKLLQR